MDRANGSGALMSQAQQYLGKGRRSNVDMAANYDALWGHDAAFYFTAVISA